MLNIRLVEEKDLDRVVEIENSIYPSPWAYSIFKREITNEVSEFYVLEKDGIIIGYGGIWKVLGEAHVTNIAVEKKYRGQGLGNTIFEFLINRVIELNYYGITLEVKASNKVAKSLYIKHGFEEVGIRKGYYFENGHREDAIIMWKMIESDNEWVK
ncbi:MAG: ribosomal protein S18-alanine N-acetyltransferase [Tissierellia bacterium]|nr:ribosomal protein S18-alanine N-acetyltransferase [Tissierellia bacterium]